MARVRGNRSDRFFGGAALVGVVAMISVLAAPDPARAADVGDLASLQAAFSNPSTVGGTATLTAPVNGGGSPLTLASGTLLLDLNGQTLNGVWIVLAAGTSLTVDDTTGGGVLTAQGPASTAGIQTTGASLTVAGGTVNATGGNNAAGIGGSNQGNGGTVTISGGTVTARGGNRGAGIGGGQGFNADAGVGDGGTVVVSGGTVNAVGGGINGTAAGIGGGWYGNGGTVTVSGGVVDATGSYAAAGIGGGSVGYGGVVNVSGGMVTAKGGQYSAGIGGGDGRTGGSTSVTGGTVIASNGEQASAIGAGRSAWGPMSELSISGSGEVIIPDGSTLIVPAGMTVPGNGQLRGEGTVTNSGAIQLPTDNVDWPGLGVLPNNFLVNFVATGVPSTAVRVFATSFTAGARELPPDPTRPGAVFTGWNTAADGSGTPFNAATAIGSDLTVYAVWVELTETTITSAPSSTQYGEPWNVSAHVWSSASPAVPNGTIRFYVDGMLVASDSVDGNGNASASLTGSFPPGDRAVTAQFVPADNRFATSTANPFTVTVVQGDTATTVTPSPLIEVWDNDVTVSGTVSAVAPASGIPTGDVQLTFTRDGAPYAAVSAPLANGSYTHQASSLPPGVYSVTADYQGETRFDASTSPAALFIIGKAATSIDVALTQPRYSGTSADVTGRVTVTNTSSTADLDNVGDGLRVYYRDAQAGRGAGGSELSVSDCTTGATVTCDFSGTVPEGEWLVWSEYDGSEHFAGAASDDAVLTVRPYETQISVAPPVAATPYNQDLPLTVTLTSPDAPAGVVTEGYFTVSVYDNTAGTGSAEWTSAEQVIPGENEATEFQVVIPGGALHAGTWYVIGTYHPSGDASFAESTSGPASLAVSALTTTTAVTVDPPTTVYGARLNGTATVTTAGATVPTGDVTINVTNESGVVATQQVTLGADGTVDFSFPADGGEPLDAGAYAVTATYAGTTNFSASTSSPTAFTVTRATTTLTVTEPTQTVDFGQAIPLTFTIARSDTPDPQPTGGTVTYTVGTATPQTVAIPAGSTTVTVDDVAAAAGPLLPGTHQVTANWTPPSQNFAPPTAATATITVNPAVLTVTITPDDTDFASGDPVTGTVTVTFEDHHTSANVPVGSGTVTVAALNQAGATIGTVTATQQPDGTFEFAFPDGLFTVGPYTLTATFAPADGAPFETPDPAETEVSVGQQQTTTTLSVLPLTAIPGQAITAVAETTTTGGTGDVLEGEQIRLTDRTGTVNLVGTINSPVAFQFTAPAPGVYYLTATFEGGTEFTGSTSAEVQLVVAAPVPTPPSTNALPSTGINPTTPLITAAALIIIGLAIAIALRRRKTRPSDGPD